jgi:hypothetical protein
MGSETERVGTRRMAIRAIAVLILVGVGFFMYKIGREFDVIIDNWDSSIDGAKYGAMGYGMVVIDGDEKKGFNMWAKDRVIKKMIGTNHRLSVRVMNEADDSVTKIAEREITLGFNERTMMISIPAVIGDSPNILTPNPLYSPEPAIAPADAPETDGSSGEDFPIGEMSP